MKSRSCVWWSSAILVLQATFSLADAAAGTLLQETQENALRNRKDWPRPKDTGRDADPLSAPILAELRHDQFLLDSEPLNTYLSLLVTRLLSGWQGPPVKIAILAKSRADDCAYTSGENHIFICSGLLRDAKSENVLAAFVSHEIAHVLLRHEGERLSDKALDAVVQGAGLVSAAKEIYEDKGIKSGSLDGFVTAQATSTLWSDLFCTAHNRDQESAADQLGTDLMIAAGFDADSGFETAFTLMANATAARSVRMKLLEEVAKARLLKLADRKLSKSESEILHSDLGTMALTKAQKSAFERLEQLNVDYDTREQRSAARKQYMQMTGDLDRPKPPEEVWDKSMFDTSVLHGETKSMLDADLLASQLEDAMRRAKPVPAKKFYEQLRKASPDMQSRALFVAAGFATRAADYETANRLLQRQVQGRYPTASAFISLATVQSDKRKQHAEALATLEAGKQKLQASRPFLPRLVGVTRNSGDMVRAIERADTCSCRSKVERLGNVFSGSIAKELQGQVDDSLAEQCRAELGSQIAAKGDKSQGLLEKIRGKTKATFACLTPD